MSFLCPAAPPASGCLSILGGEPELSALPRLLRGAVTLLVITNDLGRVLQLGRPAQLLQPLRADPIEPAADLLRRHLPVFPPAGPPLGRPRTSASHSTRSSDAAALRNSAPRNGENQ